MRTLSQNCTGHKLANLNFLSLSTDRRPPANDIKNDGMSLHSTI